MWGFLVLVLFVCSDSNSLFGLALWYHLFACCDSVGLLREKGNKWETSSNMEANDDPEDEPISGLNRKPVYCRYASESDREGGGTLGC